jgi:spore coat protein H
MGTLATGKTREAHEQDNAGSDRTVSLPFSKEAFQGQAAVASVVLLVLFFTGCEGPRNVAIGRPTPPPTAPAVAKSDRSDALFDGGRIPRLRIELSDAEAEKLRGDARRYVAAKLIEDGEPQRTYKISIKLKGAAGSFRELDDKPAFTLKTGKKDDPFHGLAKFHLNNSVQDESYLHELLASHLFREAGYPAVRTTHARVWLNDRDLGLYVLKEGFDARFIERHFDAATGNLYDGGFVRDIDQELEKDAGQGPDDFSDLRALVAACRTEDLAERRKLIEERLDVDAFLTFVALERMTAHWDGYADNANNYRIYFAPPAPPEGALSKAVFLPHGLDQIFGDGGYSLFHVPGTIAGSAVLSQREWHERYRERVKKLLPLFAPSRLHPEIDAAHARLQPVLAEIDEHQAAHHAERVRELKDRVRERYDSMKEMTKDEGANDD